GIDGYASLGDMPGATGGSRGQAYAAAALQGAAAGLSAAPKGKRNQTLNALAFRLGRMIERGWVDEKNGSEVLLGACAANKYLREHGRRATMKTIESGLEAGRKQPHPDLPERDSPSGGDGTADSDLSGLSGLSGTRSAEQRTSEEQQARGRQ